ncbi:MAG: hypothetical protein AMS25_08080 [Gemmatimonas sp. SM23_52]|nr:MAG: hypothetical protein AMS25_08080 [Gemmatimonas sp. SM23_52]
MSRDWDVQTSADRAAALLLAVCALVAFSQTPAAAQALRGANCDVPPEDVSSVWRVPGQSPPQYCRPAESQFRLFGIGDFAGTGLRLADPNLYAFTTNTGLMDTGDFSTIACCTLPMYTRGTEVSPGGLIPQYFEVQFYEAVARSDWVRNRELVPSLQSVQGGGWTFIANLGRMASIHMFQGADGSAGLLHRGVLSAAGAGCRDHDGDWRSYPHGFPLLAGSDCPETWGALGWGGRRPVNYEPGWLSEFQAKGDEFAFEFWRADPENYIPLTEKEFVGDFQTYGVMSDHGLEHRLRYGEVIPGGSGDPQMQGYPPGLDWEFNAFSFKIPTVAGMFVYEGLLVNRSEELYGIPLDYDSVYVGVEPRWLRGGDGRRAAIHGIPEMGAVIGNELGRTSDCDGGEDVPTSITCPSDRSTAGFRAGASGFIFLKSPIGDLRFKHFSDPESKFYNPGHPFVGDTITYNRLSLCGFECTQGQFSTLSMRRGWGTIAAEPIAALDGRDPNLLSEREYWMLFKPEAGSDVRLDPSDPRGPGGFNYYVPGDWSYTNKPPGAGTGPDTLFFDTCNPLTNECIALWSDTLPDHTLNWAYNASWFGVGPFPLAAGDTAPFVVAAFAAPDSARFMSLLENIYNFYVYDFYLGPGVPTPARIVSTSVDVGSRGRGETGVTLILGDDASSWRDPFALKFIERLEEAAEGTPFGRLKALNPELIDDLDAQVNSNNVSRLLILKSCNNGETFTATQSGDRCPADPSIDEAGNPIGTGWEAYAILTPDERGQFPSTWFDGSVTAGRSYLYSIVAETEGIDMAVDDSVDVDGDGLFDRVESMMLSELGIIVLPASRSALLTNVDAPNVVSVYIPASHMAGSAPATVQFTMQRGPLGADSLVAVEVTTGIESEASYRLVFGDSVQVAEYSSLGELDSTVVVLYRSARTGFAPGGGAEFTPFAQNTFHSTSADGVILAADPDEITTVTSGDTTIHSVNALAGIVVNLATGTPLFVSTSVTGSAFTPPELFSRPEFGGFVVFASSDPGTKLDEFWALEGQALRSTSWPTIRWIDASAEPTGDGYGALDIEWVGPAFARLVEVNQLYPEITKQDYAAAVTGRTDIASTATDAATIDLVAEALEVPVDEVELADIALPFTITNRSLNGGTGRPVRVAVLQEDLIDEVLLGSGPDTVTVDSVPAGAWIPGLPLILIEELDVAQTDAGGQVLLDADGEPQLSTVERVTWTSAVVGCDNRATCNPVHGPGQDGYVSVRQDMSLIVEYANPLTGESVFEFDVIPPTVGEDITALGRDGLRDVRVVPNPYIMYSVYEQETGTRRILFTNLPPEGRIRIYTAAGQFVQEMTWGPEDLMGNGDLFYNLRTREGNELSAGLYLYLVQATGPAGGNAKKLGKFIIIR